MVFKYWTEKDYMSYENVTLPDNITGELRQMANRLKCIQEQYGLQAIDISIYADTIPTSRMDRNNYDINYKWDSIIAKVKRKGDKRYNDIIARTNKTLDEGALKKLLADYGFGNNIDVVITEWHFIVKGEIPRAAEINELARDLNCTMQSLPDGSLEFNAIKFYECAPIAEIDITETYRQEQKILEKRMAGWERLYAMHRGTPSIRYHTNGDQSLRYDYDNGDTLRIRFHTNNFGGIYPEITAKGKDARALKRYMESETADIE